MMAYVSPMTLLRTVIAPPSLLVSPFSIRISLEDVTLEASFGFETLSFGDSVLTDCGSEVRVDSPEGWAVLEG
jgi:hypothetical protein